jgi:hypothetical protein
MATRIHRSRLLEMAYEVLSSGGVYKNVEVAAADSKTAQAYIALANSLREEGVAYLYDD